MTDHLDETTSRLTDDEADERLLAALAAVERSRSGGVPPVAAVMARIRASRSPLDGPAWSWTRSLRLFMLLLGRQMKVVPWQVVPATLALMAFSGLGARFFAVGWGVTVVSRAFCSMVLAGVLLSVTMAFGDSRADMISSATPLGPGAVTLVRLVFVLACDVVFGLLVTVVMGAQGYGMFGVLLVGWLSPLLLVAGVGAMLAIRFSTGVGFGVGLLLVAVIRMDLLGLMGLPAVGWIDMTRTFGQLLLAVTGLLACTAAVAFAGRLSEARVAAAAV
ncbi:hypothetical protein CS006_06710 [Bifidobacterium primatium]|uniref:Uncharacterized protein n=1 Tax=Bifidobacterium primatium TaxID=2045438 RepID=A0A2M9H820_9BIFI|nr:hypothetical protein [Bifidobacterium primatium]PJM72944.1 hypothetical protein CS006_06710 [Bifidobacterium primatium]